MISGVRKTDTIEFEASVGVASFSKATKNKGIAAIIGIVAAGADLGAAAYRAPEAVPLIDAAAKFAQDEYQEQRAGASVPVGRPGR